MIKRILSSTDLQLTYPHGIATSENENGRSVLLAWDSEKLLTLQYRNLKETLKDRVVLKKPDKRHTNECPNIKEIIIGVHETLILTETGLLFYFESSKCIERLEIAKNVLNVCSINGSFVWIRLSDDEQMIFLEVIPESSMVGNPLRSYDISFETNYCQSTWRQTNFLVKKFLFQDIADTNFLKLLSDNRSADQIFFFSVNSFFFSLSIDAADQYEIKTVETCSSDIRDFSLSQSQCIYFLLASGVIHIVYWSKELNELDNYQLYIDFDDRIICSSFFHGDLFLFSDGFKVVQSRIVSRIDENNKMGYHFESWENQLFGVVAFSIINSLDIVVCISENCIIYTFPLKKWAIVGDRMIHTTDENEDNIIDPDLFEITDEMLDEIGTEAKDILDTIDSYNKIRENINRTARQFEALVLKTNNHQLNDLFTARIRFSLTQPENEPDVTMILPPEPIQIDDRTYFSIIRIESKLVDSFFASNIWTIWIYQSVGKDNHCRSLKILTNLFKCKMDIVFPIHLCDIFYLPDYRIDLTTAIRFDSDFIYLSFPVQIIDTIRVVDLLLVTPERPVIFTEDTMEKFPLKFRIHLPIKTIKELLELFPQIKRTTYSQFSDEIYIRSLNRLCHLKIVEQIVTIRAADPGLLRMVKDFVVCGLMGNLAVQLLGGDDTNRKRKRELIKVDFENICTYIRQLKEQAMETKLHNEHTEIRKEITNWIDKLREVQTDFDFIDFYDK